MPEGGRSTLSGRLLCCRRLLGRTLLLLCIILVSLAAYHALFDASVLKDMSHTVLYFSDDMQRLRRNAFRRQSHPRDLDGGRTG